MMPYIEDYENPQIGDFFMVRTVKFLRNGHTLEWPVMHHAHDEKEDYDLLSRPHYHIDWRFMEEKHVSEHREHNRRLYPGNMYCDSFNAEYFSPIMKSEEIEISYKDWKYLRDHDYNDKPSSKLEEKFKTVKVKGMKCPHHGTNLKSCKPINGVVTCPQHGLKWKVESGELVTILQCK